MRLQRWTPCAIGVVALTLSAVAEATAQSDTSQVRIPIRKETGSLVNGRTTTNGNGITRRESGGEVISMTVTRIDSLEGVIRDYDTRLDALEAADAAAATRTAALEARINALSDSLATARSELSSARTELAALTAKVTEVDMRLQNLNDRYNRSRNRSLFGNSGFYVGMGTGVGFTTGALRNDLGYESAPQLMGTLGWHKAGSLLGIRTEWTAQRLEGTAFGANFNPDPTVFSGTAMATLNFPINSAKTNSVYVMGGGGFYQFRNFGATSNLGQTFTPSLDGDTESKWGLTAGAGLEIHVLGATSLFAQSAITNVSADNGSLRWMPVAIGFVLK